MRLLSWYRFSKPYMQNTYISVRLQSYQKDIEPNRGGYRANKEGKNVARVHANGTDLGCMHRLRPLVYHLSFGFISITPPLLAF